jgi:O-antigen ligase
LIIGVGVVAYWLITPLSDVAPAMGKLLRWLALLVPAYIVLQLVPLPIFLVRILSPERGQILDGLRLLVPPVDFAPLSISPATTSTHLFRIIGCLLVFLLIREVASRSRRPGVVVIPLIAIAGLEAGFGLMNADGAPVEGTYWNRNHFAGLLEMVLPIAIAYAIALLRARRSRYGPTIGRVLAAVAILFLAAMMLVALTYSLSKMGFVAGVSGLFLMALVASMASVKGWKKWASVGLLGAVFLLVLVCLPPDQLVSSYGSVFSDKTAEGRLPMWSDSLHLLTAYPLVGSGLGTYDTAFQKYQTVLVDIAFNFAHNDYLELATELGAMGFLVIAGLVLAIFAKTLRAGTQYSDQDTRYLAWGCAGAIAAIGIHSLTDFNMYIPANALVLAWIFGIVASFPPHSTPPAPLHALAGRGLFRGVAIALGCLLLIYAPAWILLETRLRGNLQAESRLCRFGVCDTDAVVASETANHGGIVAAVPAGELAEALRRDPAAPSRWCDLGEAMFKLGRVDQARVCFSNAQLRGPHIPPVLLRTAHFYHNVQEDTQALQQTSRVLGMTSTYDALIFDTYWREKLPLSVILSTGLPPQFRAANAYLRYQMRLGEIADSMTVWDWDVSHNYADDGLAREYTRFLFDHHKYEAAAKAWAHYLGDRRNGYLESNWLFNGDFESEPSGIAFDWRVEDMDGDVRVTLDPSVAHTGSRSLRIQFGGKENVNYSQTSQTAFVKAGRYRFAAFVRTEGITTDQGIAFRLFDPESPSRLDTRTEQLIGTTDWKRIEQIIVVPPGASLLTVQIIRQRSLRFDSYIAGTAWIDTLSLSKVE